MFAKQKLVVTDSFWEDIQGNVKTEMKELLGNYFQQCFQTWQRCRNARTKPKGMKSEGD
jgi:hypothetical protein